MSGQEPPSVPAAHTFPWGPALLAAACLVMAVWTWTRYSYCWDIDINDILVAHLPIPDLVSGEPISVDSSQPGWPKSFGDHPLRHRYVRVRGRVTAVSSSGGITFEDGTRDPLGWTVTVHDGTGDVGVLVPPSPEEPYREGDEVVFRGRLILNVWWWFELPDPRPLALDTSPGRWHPAAVGGLAVGAMGGFVFALYLASWLRARRSTRADPVPYSRAVGSGPR